MYHIDGIGFTDSGVENFKKVGISPAVIKQWIAEGRKRGASDRGIARYINDKYTKMATSFNETAERPASFMNKAGAVLSEVPFLGSYLDEATAYASSKINGTSYEDELKKERANIKRGQDFFKNDAHGAWKYLPEAANIGSNAVLAVGTLGATLMPQVSTAQGAIEGYGRGEGSGGRTSQAVFGAATGYAVPKVLNRILPTGNVQKSVVKSMAGQTDNALRNIVANAKRLGISESEYIAKYVPRSMRDDLFARLGRNTVGENVFRSHALKGLGETLDPKYNTYLANVFAKTEGLGKYANKFNENFTKLAKDALNGGVVGNIDPRLIARQALNKTMKNASPEARSLAGQVMDSAIANRGVAKQLSKKLVSNPWQSGSGSKYAFLKRFSQPAKHLANIGDYNTITTKVLAPDLVRGGVDALLEDKDLELIGVK